MNYMNRKWVNTELEIMLYLLKGKAHGRALSEVCNIPLATVQRALSRLVEKNVLDAEPLGRNKMFFIKNTIEARSHVFMAESYRLIKAIEAYPVLRIVAEHIAGRKDIKLAAIFGSYAKFKARQGSDIDVYIETSSKKIKREIEDMGFGVSVKMGKFNLKSLLIREIIKNHVIIKGIEEFYEKSRFFEKDTEAGKD